MAKSSATSHVARAKKAYELSGGSIDLIRDLNSYALPARNPRRTGSTKKVKDRYDPTLASSAFRFSGRMLHMVTPPQQKGFELSAGPMLSLKGDEKKKFSEFLQNTTALVQAVFDGSNLHIAAGEMFLDLFGGTGALLMVKDKDFIVRYVAVPVVELALEEDAFGELNGWHWNRKMLAKDILGTWPKGKFKAERKRELKDKGSEPYEVCQSTVVETKNGKTEHVTRAFFMKDDDQPIINEVREPYTPWVTPRYYKLPGDPFGIGLGTLALPSAKTADRIVELTLRAALFAVMGLWMYKDDRAFNPKSAKFVPGAMWKVSSTGGPLGPAVQKLDVPGRMDLAHVSLKELREMIREITNDNALPPSEGAVRSATEIVERLKRLVQTDGTVFGRLTKEVIKPLVQYAIHALHELGMIEADIKIDELIAKVQITSPIARGQQAEAVSQIVQWLEIMLATSSKEEINLYASLEEIYPEIGRMLGVSENYIRSNGDRKALLAKMAELMAAQQQTQEAPPPA